MMQQVVKQWDKHKSELAGYFLTHKQSEYDTYLKLVQLIIKYVLNDSSEDTLDIDDSEIVTIDHGDYQGTQLFLMHKNAYQPTADEYYWTYAFYGSCSGCDALLGISGYKDGLPTEDQVRQYMTLCLHLVQRLARLLDRLEFD